MPKIYTRTGDEGLTGLYSGQRKSKSDHIFEILGMSDTVTSSLGVVITSYVQYHKIDHDRFHDQLRQIQKWLQNLNSDIATISGGHYEATRFDGDGPTQQLEEWIDAMDQNLPPLKTFILPGGRTLSAAHMHVARTHVRALERRLVDAEITDSKLRFVNRLSDYCFTAARWLDRPLKSRKCCDIPFSLVAAGFLLPLLCVGMSVIKPEI